MKFPSLSAAALVAVAAVACAPAASAADLPRRAPAYVPPAYAPIFTWTGAYAGFNAGYGFGSVNGAGRALPGNPDGGLVGGTVGYNFQYNQLVAGIEADLAYAAVGDTTTSAGPVTVKSTLNFVDTVRGRVGYSVARALFFVTGGYAGGDVHTTVYDTPRNIFAANTNYLNGYALGAGVEYAFMPNLSAKAEYLYTDLGRAFNFTGTQDVTRIGYSTSNVRIGINYHF